VDAHEKNQEPAPFPSAPILPYRLQPCVRRADSWLKKDFDGAIARRDPDPLNGVRGKRKPSFQQIIQEL
jgi:hypothetical protein